MLRGRRKYLEGDWQVEAPAAPELTNESLE